MSGNPGMWGVFGFVHIRSLELLRQSRFWKPVLVPICLFIVGFFTHLLLEKNLDKALEEVRIALAYGLIPGFVYLVASYAIYFGRAFRMIDMPGIPESRGDGLIILPPLSPPTEKQEKTLVHHPTMEQIERYGYSGKSIMRRVDGGRSDAPPLHPPET